MNEKINLVEILKDCPKGMALDCAIYENVELDYIEHNPESTYPIHCLMKTNGGYNTLMFTHYGCNDKHPNAKCVIFPKGKTTWEGFQRPFKDGDIIFTHANCLKVGVGNTWISIFKESRNGGIATYVDYAEDRRDYYSDLDGDKALLCMKEDILRQRYATEEEKQKLFDAIKANGYKWNAETKTLEKLIGPKFKVGDKIKDKNNRVWFVAQVSDKHFDISSVPNTEGYFVPIEDQDDYELVPNKFDITTLKPFESRVLVRTNNRKWVAAFYSHYDKDSLLHHCAVGGLWYEQCVPYNGNEHLLDTTKDCDEYYKTWE